MNGFLYSLTLQWKLDIRSKSLLVTYYIVPLIFFLLMGGIFTSVMPDMGSTLI
ncbi:MAG: ABC transporter permease, partial [Streptococcus sp.]